MSDEPAISVLLLWHQHQPFYKDPLSNRFELPWVRLHAIKDYYDMVALLDEFPKIRVNFNLVPSLLVQLDDYATGKAQEKWVELTLKSAGQLSFEDGQFLLNNFFMANWERMIEPHPRYRELLDKRGRRSSTEDLARAANYFKEQDWRDLQMWFNLAWFDPLWRERDSFIQSMFAKGRGFTEKEKQQVVKKQIEICGLVALKHRELAERGQIEITATPFYHPILPLLCDTESARVAMPQATLPTPHFAHPEDAREQIERALQDHERRFGRRPQGMWPSEGSVSEEAAGLMSSLGVRWAATDESVLSNSMGERYQRDHHLYQAHRFAVGEKNLHFFFRDHELSDAIGFVYAGWNPEDAAANFVERLHAIRKRLSEHDNDAPVPRVIPVILDGENCWEYYDQDGLPFLRAFYRRLSDEPLLETVRGSDFLDRHGDRANLLPRLWPGSWINSNFAIWIGHPEDNRAWELLRRTREFLSEYIRNHPDQHASAPVKLAWEEIYIAEGSDWCWWYGDDHSSANDGMFDYLFRKHLMNVYAVLGGSIPEDLHLPIKQKVAKTLVRPPVDFIEPQIDGKVTNYFEWHSAGSYQPEGGASGTMHRVQSVMKGLYFGFDLKTLYLRIDFHKAPVPDILKDITLKLHFLQPAGIQIGVRFNADPNFVLEVPNQPQAPLIGRWAAAKILEIAIPLASIPNASQSGFEFMVGIEQDGREVERWPADASIAFAYPSAESFIEHWTV